MEEYDGPCLGIFGIPAFRDANHVLYIPMYTELGTPIMFQEFMSQNVGNGDEGVPKEGAERDIEVVNG